MLLLSVEDAGRKTMVDDWGTIVERRMDSDSLGDAGVMLLVFGMLVCVCVCVYLRNQCSRSPRW